MIIFTLGFICVIFWLAVMLYGLRTFFQLIFWLCVRPARLLVISALCFGAYYSVTNSDWFASYLDEVHAEQARVAAEPDQTGAPYAVPLSDDTYPAATDKARMICQNQNTFGITYEECVAASAGAYPLPTYDMARYRQVHQHQCGLPAYSYAISCAQEQVEQRPYGMPAWAKLNKVDRARCLKLVEPIQDYFALRWCAGGNDPTDLEFLARQFEKADAYQMTKREQSQ